MAGTQNTRGCDAGFTAGVDSSSLVHILIVHFQLQIDKVNSFLMINITRTRICKAVDIVDERSSFALLTG